MSNLTEQELQELSSKIKIWGKNLGFQQVGITDTDLNVYEKRFHAWLKKGYHGTLNYMEKHGLKRTRPPLLVEKTLRIISVRMDYLPPDTDAISVLENKKLAYVSRYALGRDYHRLIRKRLEKLVKQIKTIVSDLGYRVFCDSAPVLEKAIAEKAGLGFIGKHTNLINTKAGSWFFLGEIYTDLPLPIDSITPTHHCGSCQACITVCPTGAIVAPYQLDARRCISYLTIELKDSIPLSLRPLIGNRIYGCDDCQLFCPWNKFAKITAEKDFYSRHELTSPLLIDLFDWDEKTFLKRTEGSAIRRIGYILWLRNIAVALGNAPFDKNIVKALSAKKNHQHPLVSEHVNWAYEEQIKKSCQNKKTN